MDLKPPPENKFLNYSRINHNWDKQAEITAEDNQNSETFETRWSDVTRA